MPFAVLGILFVLGSAWSQLSAHLHRSEAAAESARAAEHDRLVAEQVAGYCKARVDEEIAALEEEQRLCPRLVETTATRYRVDLAYRAPSREYHVDVRALYPAADHDWSDDRGSSLHEPAFRFSKAQGGRLVEISGFEPSAERRLEFLHRFVAVGEQCLEEGARLESLPVADLAARAP